ncbi:hypothetical protein Patl1_31358 [Pistacia atlantica]|uniref:Uncharacterized protein n=1 Tax=Pistacia atlantica TaxID=434234 RepID=A0ACC1API9_9ROSI|nr:hypothetical protein Patl1_31358 [Pistacia atlantica]
MSRPRTNRIAVSFENFFQGWLVRQEHYLEELLSAKDDCHDDLKDLINRVLAHYHQYYEEKSRLARSNIFLLFSPTWFTAFEQTFFWIAGFKPTLAFALVNDAITLTQEQNQRINSLKGEIRMEEKILNDELAKIQESVAAPPIMELARRWGSSVDGGITEEQEVMQSLRSALESLVASADLLRTTTARKVVEILNPVQNVRFLAAATQLQLRIRSWGLQREGEGQETQIE